MSESAPAVERARALAAPLSISLLPAAARASARLSRIAARMLLCAAELRALRARGDASAPAGSGALVLSRASADALRIHGVALDVRGALPRGPALLASNHVSYLDPVVLMALHPCLPAAKRQVADWPIFGGLARAGGVHFVDRGNRADGDRVVRALAATLRAGTSALNFPEGTTSEGWATLPFRAGGFAAARLARAPVVPVALRYWPRRLAWIGDATFVPHYLRFAAEPDPVVHVRFGLPLLPCGDERATAAACKAAVDRLLSEMP